MRFFKKKANPVYQTILMSLLGNNPIWTKKEIARLTEAGYQNCSTVYSCVNERAGGAAGIPWVLYRKTISKDTRKEKIDEHPLIDLIRRPNPQEGQSAFIMKTMAFYLIGGNSYLTRVGPENKPPLELYSIRPDRMKVLPGNAMNPIRGYRYTVSGNKNDFSNEEILHLKMFHPLNDWYGLSPIEVAAKEVDIAAMSREWNMKLLQNDCRPPGGIVVEGKLDDKQRELIEKRFTERMAGYKNVGRPPVLEGGIKWEPWAITPKDMDWLNSDKVNMRKICSIYNVAPELIGDAENKTYSNYQEARKALYIEAILPDMDFLRDEFNNWLSPAFGDRLYLDYDRDSIEALKEEQSALYKRAQESNFMKLNEKRAMVGLDEVPEGDVIYMPISMVPVGYSPKKEDEEKRFGFKSKNKSFWQAPERKEALWNNFVLRIKAKEKPFIPLAEEYMKEQGKRIQKALKDIYTISGLEPAGIFDLEAEAKAYQKKFIPWYADAAQRAGEAGLVVSKGDLYSLESKPRGIDFEMTPELEELLQEMVFNSGTTVNETMIDIILRDIKRANTEGWTVEELAQLINHQVDDFMPWRSRLWSRTEGVKIENWGQLEGYKKAEFVEKKGWLSAFAPDTRETHMAADAQYSENPIPLEEAFIIGGESLQYPGDPAGSAENVCNCLCSTYPEVMELQGG